MNTKVFINYLLMAFILVATSKVMATAQSDYDLAVELYKSDDSVSAARYFESAQQQGMDSISLKYNLASSYYKIGRYEESKKLFTRLSETQEMRDLAIYHLGLIAIKQKDGSLARGYFKSIANSGKDEKLIKLSKKQLLALTKKEKTWGSAVSLNLGYDNNISSVAEDSVLGKADNFYELFASTDFLITGRRKNGWIANASLFGINFSDTDTNDENHYMLGLKRTLQLDDWDTGIKLNVSKSTYGGDDFQTSVKMDVTGRKPLAKQQYVYLRYQAVDYRSDKTIYDYLEGWRQRARVEYRQYSKNNIQQIYYELELNSRGLLVTSTDAYEYSPTRHTVRGLYSHIINNQWWLNGDLSYRFSDYSPSPSIDREDNQWKLALSADYRFDKTLKLTAKYQHLDNSSTVDRYTYDKSIIKIGLSKLF